jgi:hypothetical protein
MIACILETIIQKSLNISKRFFAGFSYFYFLLSKVGFFLFAIKKEEGKDVKNYMDLDGWNDVFTKR